jgi:hypothetical protein
MDSSSGLVTMIRKPIQFQWPFRNLEVAIHKALSHVVRSPAQVLAC